MTQNMIGWESGINEVVVTGPDVEAIERGLARCADQRAGAKAGQRRGRRERRAGPSGVCAVDHDGGLQGAALGAGDGHLAAGLDEGLVGMAELGPPEADRPAGLLRNGRAAGHHQNLTPGGRTVKMNVSLNFFYHGH